MLAAHVFIEVGKANCAYLALFVRLFHLLIAREIITGGLMDEKKINIIRVEAGKSLVYCIRLLIETGPQLGL